MSIVSSVKTTPDVNVRSIRLKCSASARTVILDKPPTQDEDWHCRIKVYTLGRFSLVIDGRPIIFQKKAQQRPLALLKSLIAFGGREVPEETLSYTIWPDAEGDKAHEDFASALKRLRKLIGIDGAIRLSNRCMTLDSHCCWVDVWDFERQIGASERHAQHGEIESAVRCFSKAEKRYQGDFLSCDCDVSWTIKMRERLQYKFLSNICQIADVLCSQGQFRLAMTYCHKGLEADEMAEGLYQRIILCHQGLGQYGEALSTYHRLKKILAETFDIAPSPKSSAMISAIKSRKTDMCEGAMYTTAMQI